MTTSLQDIVDPLAESSDGASIINTDLLKAIDQRVLWLATRMIHEANVIRPNTENTTVVDTRLPAHRSSRFWSRCTSTICVPETGSA